MIIALVSCLFFAGARTVSGRDFSGLAQASAENILEFLAGQRNVNAAVIKFDNKSGVSDVAAQKFYQLMVSRIEADGTIGFTDLMINFQKNRGVFNLNRTHSVNYTIYIKLTRNQANIGAGIAIFSKRLDKTVFIKYLEASYRPGERDMFETVTYGFEASGFSRVVELEAKPGLLDVKLLMDSGGRQVFLFFYPNEIEGYTAGGTRLNRLFSRGLTWDSPYYPVQEPEGKLTVIDGGDKQYVSVGGNFTKGARLLVFTGVGLENVSMLGFLPFRLIDLNGSRYLAGARYAVGKNFFRNQLVLVPFSDGQAVENEELVKEVPPFFSLDFSLAPGTFTLNSVHLVKRDYRYIYLADNFEPLPVEEEGQRGASLCALGNRWLAVSAYAEGNDSLYFYNIEDGNRRLAYESKLDGQVVFISEGSWKAAHGFWVYVKRSVGTRGRNLPGKTVFTLQFWSKKDKT